ncbi:ABC-ATPase domain-containing protein [Oceanirhabdus sp. W0125-5]|uniref:ABC-ATPase domain-containing protein n=1 Tax=Oceanirhabdus sp. W0125-5 TaxID=2999116 RepID=UPI0022F2C02E|nr:ABC-ATPase domain-containing protein [Oceanirhabdus sp. W0125-5]WBW97646.1 ABC-ATPase domain-containing protein [Oceanirhabdus sp. W0125-5]
MREYDDLKELLLKRLNGKGYKAYKEIQGQSFNLGFFEIRFDYIQGDPFASPSKIRIIVENNKHGFPGKYYKNKIREIAFKDYLTRIISNNIYSIYDRVSGSGKSGLIGIDRPGQEVIDRTSIKINKNSIEARLEIGLPAFGRKIAGKEASDMILGYLPKIIEKSINIKNINESSLARHIELAEDQEYIREELKKKGYCAFIANNSILPRESGVSQRPMKEGAIKFISPESMKITFNCPHRGELSGMGIKKGVTLIVGGGYHGKSTLLKALELGVYNHIANDGREFVIMDNSAVKVRAEDGRSVEKVNISSFINNLPNGKDTYKFKSENASGSTSQSSNIIEALEVGAKTLLIDEDTSATNFMIRDHKMKMLIHKDKEPITPFIDRVKELHEKHGISSILVIGSSGEYFHKADTVIMMDEYRAIDVTDKAKELFMKEEVFNNEEAFDISCNRVIMKNSFPRLEGKSKIKSKGLSKILINKDEIDLSSVEQIISGSQTNAITEIIKYSIKNLIDDRKNLKDIINGIYTIIEDKGLDEISSSKGHPGNLAIPRKNEIAAAFNRYRKLNVK